jgi:hypothetical protein
MLEGGAHQHYAAQAALVARHAAGGHQAPKRVPEQEDRQRLFT